MKEEDIKLPAINYKLFVNTKNLWDSINRLGFKQFIESWPIEEVESILRKYATEAVKLNMLKQPETELIPFDLEAAKRGDPIVTRDGRKARFVAYVPEAEDGNRVIVFVDGNKSAYLFFDCGLYFGDQETAYDLFMSPKPMKTVYVNFHKNGECFVYQFRFSATTAAANAMERNPTIATAVPVQIPKE